jgi:hypothetical protein
MISKAFAIPTVQDTPFYSLRTRLDGAEYILHFSWNQREERWYLTIADADDVTLVSSLKLVCNHPLLRFYQANPAVPPGEIVVHVLEGDTSPPGLDDLGIGLRCELTYYAVTEAGGATDVTA